MREIGFGIIGLGRMGTLHAEHLSGSVRGARLIAASVEPAHREQLETSGEAPCPLIESVEELVSHPDINAVLIVSPSSAHHEHIALAVAAGKPIFCEKPLTDRVNTAQEAVAAVERAGVPFQIGFQRRFDPGYVRARELIREGATGDVEFFRGITCDRIPPLAYLRTSGGLFWDLGVHDFDAARFLMGDDIVAVHATGAIKVEPALSQFDDIDYGVVVLRFRGGALGVVQNSWRAPWGYEIRAEVYGSRGKVVTELDEMVPTRLYTERGYTSERYHQFIERFREAYRLEVQSFVDALRTGEKPEPDARDGLAALEVADAATRSRREDRWVEVGR
jgi:myo-inositol 2-dehydrogenase / D-chiro-inositol 1-dehydrogenase